VPPTAPAHPDHCEIDHERIVEEYGEREHGHRMLIPQWSVEGKREIRPPSTGVAASAPTQAPAPQENNMAEGLGELAALHASGALSDAEFAAAKARLIDPT
jgi:hypothetical protein